MRQHILTAGLTIGAALLVGCSTTPDPGPLFNNENGQAVTCMAHQNEKPGARYTTREMRNSGETLSLMRYYTAHGTKPYCDNAPADEVDRAWGQLYLDLGGASERVTTAVR